ncbi:MAG: hypothetical protein HY329_21890 [Chloroflexi bacterium]|nr:hypothetical protein [Chloroflexota bacterium]
MKEPQLPAMVAVILVSLLSITHVSAYKQARVTNGLSLTVVSTNSAALALSSVSSMATISSGVMRIDFQQGNGAARSFNTTRTSGGFTLTGDSYQMRDVFRVTNNDTQDQCVSVFVSSGSPTNLTDIYGRLNETFLGTQLASALGAQTANRVNLTAGSTMKLDFHWSATSSDAGGTFTIRVTSANQTTCP